ncbi:MAG TPA: PIG-L family deacetylase [Acidimicrobiia bacterium]|nr:PIG-L family deacetylase [Acidimicrobiia bacterium]
MPYTLVLFHAHPDDEAIATGGTMALAKSEGHRVVLVSATRGELGEHAPESLAPGERLVDRRVAELHAAAEVLGADRVEFLDYLDSGMAGEPTNDAPGSFASADVEEAAVRLARILDEEQADVLTIYDENGNYGHPDHIQVHVVGVRAAELAGTRRVYEATANRDHLRRMMEQMPQDPDAPEAPADLDTLGVTEDQITTTVDVRAFVDAKRAAMIAHASQIPDDSFFLQMPLEVFREAFGWEWFIRRDIPRSQRETTLFADLG